MATTWGIESADNFGMPTSFEFNWDDTPWQTGGVTVSNHTIPNPLDPYDNGADMRWTPQYQTDTAVDNNWQWKSDPYGVYYQFRNPNTNEIKYGIQQQRLSPSLFLEGQTDLGLGKEFDFYKTGKDQSKINFYDQNPLTGVKTPYKMWERSKDGFMDKIDKWGLAVGMAIVGGLA